MPWLTADAEQAPEEPSSFLAGIRVLEMADELGEFAGRILADLGADVIKVEPPGGEITRTYGPFYRDIPDPDRSLHFWHYNLGKRSLVLDLDTADGQATFSSLASTADIVLETRARGYLPARGVGFDALRERNAGLIYVRLTPFGDDGPWADYLGSDLVHLALGGVMMNCGYDPQPGGTYDTPPIAPQMWQSYQIAGEMAAMAAIAALVYRRESGRGQQIGVSVHQAVSANTETDLPDWIYLRQLHRRQTCRHSMPTANPSALVMTKDGRWLLPYRTYLRGAKDTFKGVLPVLKRYGLAADLGDEKYQSEAVRADPAVVSHIDRITETLINRFKFDRDIWREVQAEGLPWAPLRRPEENLDDPHFSCRDTFRQIYHPELDESFTYVTGRWYSPDAPWKHGPRPPLMGEHTAEILAALAATRSDVGVQQPGPVETGAESRSNSRRALSRHGKPFALSGVRVLDLSWMLASAGAGRFFTSLGAEVIKVEHESHWDRMRWGVAPPPPGGRAARDLARAEIPTPDFEEGNPNQSGAFMEINAGKRGISLNLKSERGKELLCQLLRDADIVIEGFSPGTFERMGFGYDRLRALNPRLIYVQQSGPGQRGTYGGLRTFGPSAQAFSGISEMSGLRDPYPPAGIGYSYLDWYGAYNMAMAMMAALYRQRTTGLGCYIDSSQIEIGIYLTGTAVLDFSANGKKWARYGNESPYKLAAPHGAYPAMGADRWIAIACFSDVQWKSLLSALDAPHLDSDPRFCSLTARAAHQEALDQHLGELTSRWSAYELMEALQAAGVPAGVCQTAGDRCDADPQLAHLGWLVDLPQTTIGTWPVKEVPVTYSDTPTYVGGSLGRSGPNYGQDNYYVYHDVLGLAEDEMERLRKDGVL